MTSKTKLSQALELLDKHKHLNEDCNNALLEYYKLKQSGQEFMAASLVVSIFKHYTEKKAVHG